MRSVWISFAGRIAAQIIGAVATVTLGVLVLGKGAAPAKAATHKESATPTVLVATPVRTHGETVIVMMPATGDGQVDTSTATQVAETYETSRGPKAIARARWQMPTDPPAPQSADPSDDTHVSPESRRE